MKVVDQKMLRQLENISEEAKKFFKEDVVNFFKEVCYAAPATPRSAHPPRQHSAVSSAWPLLFHFDFSPCKPRPRRQLLYLTVLPNRYPSELVFAAPGEEVL